MAVTPISAERRQKLRRLGEWHDQWVLAHAGDTPFTPREQGSDYNLHVVDIEADGATEDQFQRGARRIMGLPTQEDGSDDGDSDR